MGLSSFLAGPARAGLLCWHENGVGRRQFRGSMAAEDEPQRNGIAAAALMPEGMQWGGQPMKLETEFLITKRIAPSLELASARLEDVLHAQIYLADPEDYSAFAEVWTRRFGKSQPTWSVIPCIEHGLAPYHCKIEINVLSAKPGSAAQKRQIDAGAIAVAAI